MMKWNFLSQKSWGFTKNTFKNCNR